MKKSAFKEYELGTIGIEIIDGDRGKSYPHPNDLYKTGHCVFLSASNVTPSGFKFDTVVYISEDKDKVLKNGKLNRNDIVITTRGTVGNVAIYDEMVPYSQMRINSGMLIIRCGDQIDSRYLYYAMCDSSFKTQIEQIRTGSAQPQLPKSLFVHMKVIVPPICIQKKIAYFLDGFDKKIQTNEQINKNLEEQAQAIYTDIFSTNADPVWPIGHLSDLITVKYGKDHKKLKDGVYPVYGSGGVMRYVERPLFDKESVLIPRKGTLNNVMYVNKPFWSVDTMFFTEMRIPNIAKYVFHFVKSKDLLSLNAGSAVPSMTTDILNAMELYIPDARTLQRFENLVHPIYSTMENNVEESDRLTAIRDALLPKLMSGEIDVSNLNL